MQSDSDNSPRKESDSFNSKEIFLPPSPPIEAAKLVENIIYNCYIQERNLELSRVSNSSSIRGSHDCSEEVKEND
jgi:hypothetical protein